MMAAGTMAILFGSVSCGNLARTGRSPVMLVIATLTGESGSKPGTSGGTLLSDVVVLVKTTVNGVDTFQKTYFDDSGKVTLQTVQKNQSSPAGLLQQVVMSRYHVVFVRSDGHNTPGVDVPYAFDGGLTGIIGPAGTALGFELVRHQAKLEPPLITLQGLGGLEFISTIAQITFYGQDLAGNDVQVTGTIGVNFADFADP
jgi:hypothetical protein